MAGYKTPLHPLPLLFAFLPSPNLPSLSSPLVRSDSGYIGSFIVHLAVIGVAILFARMQPDPAREIEDQDPLLLEVWQGDGSERDPGIPGQARGIAQGVSTGDKSKLGLGAKAMIRVKPLNADKLLKEMKAEEEKAAAESKAEAKAAAESTKATKTTPDEKHSKTSPKESLDDFNKSKPKGGKSTASGATASGATASAKSSGGPKGRAGIQGTSVGGEGTGHGTGKDGIGRPNGKGRNGGDGGSGNAEKLFAGDVNGKFADVFIPLFREQGGELSSDKDSGTVKVRVSPSGLVSFAGWFRRPSDPLVERLVIESIQKMRPVRTPPGGEEYILNIPVSGSVPE